MPTTNLKKELREAIEHLTEMVDRSPSSMFYESGIRDAWEEVDALEIATAPPDELRRLAKFWREHSDSPEDQHNARWCEERAEALETTTEEGGR
jgi:hypothetical protein